MGVECVTERGNGGDKTTRSHKSKNQEEFEGSTQPTERYVPSKSNNAFSIYTLSEVKEMKHN